MSGHYFVNPLLGGAVYVYCTDRETRRANEKVLAEKSSSVGETLGKYTRFTWRYGIYAPAEYTVKGAYYIGRGTMIATKNFAEGFWQGLTAPIEADQKDAKLEKKQ